jgi:hypothetical protein
MMEIEVTGLGSKEDAMGNLREVLEIVRNKLLAEKIPLTSFLFNITHKGKKVGEAAVINRDIGLLEPAWKSRAEGAVQIDEQWAREREERWEQHMRERKELEEEQWEQRTRSHERMMEAFEALRRRLNAEEDARRLGN